MLKILPDNYRGDIQVNLENCSKNHRWYLDGTLEKLCGTDLATVYNLDEHPEFTRQYILSEGRRINNVLHDNFPEWVTDLYLTGIVPVKVEGVAQPCVGYFWVSRESDMANISEYQGRVKYTEWDQFGLVCLEGDKEACNNAMEQILRFMK